VVAETFQDRNNRKMGSRNHQSGCDNRGDGDLNAKARHNLKFSTENNRR
jgi:hypothetical protein